ncbi:MAG: hypothetical protein ACK55I_10390, partial [bacterium]
MALVPDHRVEVRGGGRPREALLGAHPRAGLGAHLDELVEAVVVDDHHVAPAVARGLQGASPVGHHRQRAHDEHPRGVGEVADGEPRGEGLAEPDVVGQE